MGEKAGWGIENCSSDDECEKIPPGESPGGFDGGEGGIRTLDTLRYTRSPGARTRPDYATSPIVLVLCLTPPAGGIIP